MAEVRTTRFHGMRPALHNTLQPGEGQGAAFAERARNTYLRDGAIIAMRGDKIVQTLPFVAKSITKLPSLACCAGLYALPYCASVVEAPPAACCPCDGQVIAFGSECCPDGSTAHKRCDPCSGECWPLVVPQPTLPPVISGYGPTAMTTCGHTEATSCAPLTCTSPGSSADDTGANVNHGKGADVTSYVVTWVDQFGVESPPSPPSTVVVKWDDQVVTLSNLAQAAPANAVAQRIYRAVRDYPVQANDAAVQSASYQLVAERDLPVADTFVDDLRLCDLPGGTLMTLEDCPPPPCFEQVLLLDSGYYVGFSCNDLLFSERHEPWNWPERYRKHLPDKIVGIAGLGDVLFVATTGSPYRVKLTPQHGGINDGLPTQERVQGFDTAIDVQQFPENWPCVARETMVGTPFGAMYATRIGLVALRVDAGSATLVSRKRIDQDRWREWVPNQAVWHDGYYLGLRAHTGRGFLFEVPQDGRQMEFGDFVDVDFGVSRLHSGRDGRLYGVQGNNIVGLFEANTKRVYQWRSRIFRAAGYTQMGAAKVVAEYGQPVRFSFFVGGRKVFERTVSSSRPFRLPKVPRHTDFAIEVSGVSTVTELHVGPNMRALATNATSAGSGQGAGEG